MGAVVEMTQIHSLIARVNYAMCRGIYPSFIKFNIGSHGYVFDLNDFHMTHPVFAWRTFFALQATPSVPKVTLSPSLVVV